MDADEEPGLAEFAHDITNLVHVDRQSQYKVSVKRRVTGIDAVLTCLSRFAQSSQAIRSLNRRLLSFALPSHPVF